MSRPSAHDPSHHGIMTQPLGVVDVLVSGKPTEHRPPQHTDKSVPAVLAGAGVGEPFASRLRKAESIIKLAIGEKPSIRGNDRTAKLEHQPAVEIEPKRLAIRFTRWVRHDIGFRVKLNMLIIIAELLRMRLKLSHHPANAG